jgi:hypothetical protein
MSQVNFSKKKIRFICVGRPALLIFDAVQRKTETLWKSQKLVDSKGVNFWFVGELIVKEGEDLTLVMLDITPDLLEEEHKAAIVSSIADEHWRTWNDIPTNTKLSLIYERFCPRGRFVSGELTGKDAYSLFQDYKTLCEQWLENRCSTEDPAPDAAVLGGQPSVPTGSAILGTASQCYHPDHIQFCRDMAEAGIATQIDGMRFFWHGPTATCTDISQIMSKTQILVFGMREERNSSFTRRCMAKRTW